MIKKKEIELLFHMMSMQKVHPSYIMTGAMCIAAAAVGLESIVEQALKKRADTQYLRIGHASGILECGVDYRKEGSAESR